MLSDIDAFLSFARLSARGKPSEQVILDWVRKRGLLRRRDPSSDAACLPDKTINQESVSVEDFWAESLRSYRLLRIFEVYRGDDVGTLRSRISFRRLHPPDYPAFVFYDEVLLDGEPTSYPVDPVRDDDSLPNAEDLTDEMVREACKFYIQGTIEPDISGIRPVFGIGGRLAFRCPDLRTALYWQFASLVDGRRPSAICKGCEGVFVKKRKDQKVCNATCRSRKKRKFDRKTR